MPSVETEISISEVLEREGAKYLTEDQYLEIILVCGVDKWRTSGHEWRQWIEGVYTFVCRRWPGVLAIDSWKEYDAMPMDHEPSSREYKTRQVVNELAHVLYMLGYGFKYRRVVWDNEL